MRHKNFAAYCEWYGFDPDSEAAKDAWGDYSYQEYLDRKNQKWPFWLIVLLILMFAIAALGLSVWYPASI